MAILDNAKMTESDSGHTEFDDLVILAVEQAENAVVRRTIDRLDRRLYQYKKWHDQTVEFLHSVRIGIGESIPADMEPDAQLCRIHDALCKYLDV